MPEAARPTRQYALDGLRFLAAMLVLMTHYVSAGWPYWQHGLPGWSFQPLYRVTEWGWMGVNLFFIISGYAICMSSWGKGLGSFFASRVARLFPAYLVCVLITFTVMRLRPLRGVPTTPELLINLTMLQTPYGAPNIDGAYWTLWVELLFYLSFAIVIWRGLTYQRVVGFCVIWTVAAVLAVQSGIPAIKGLVQVNWFMYFVGGVVLYLMRRFGPNLLLWGILALSAMLAINDQGPFVELYFGPAGFAQRWLIGAAVVVGCFALMLVVALGGLDWVRWRWLTTAGAVTYPLYLLHSFIGWRLISHFSGRFDPNVVLAGVVGLMLTSAWLVHRFVERPLSGRIRRALERSMDGVRKTPTESTVEPATGSTVEPVVEPLVEPAVVPVPVPVPVPAPAPAPVA